MHPFSVLADPVRRRILELLAEGERSAGDITAIIQQQFRLTQPAVSQQLKVLRESGFAIVRVEGSRRIYAIDGAPLSEADLWLTRFRAFWEPKLEALETEIARGKRERRQRKPSRQWSAERPAQPGDTPVEARRKRQ